MEELKKMTYHSKKQHFSGKTHSENAREKEKMATLGIFDDDEEDEDDDESWRDTW